MAKGNRQLIALICTVCKTQNYVVEKNRVNKPDKLSFSKFCRLCHKHTSHKETSKLK
ncbi:MAG: 50S ribosomal protein L33 [Patescibacteria group bacterium]